MNRLLICLFSSCFALVSCAQEKPSHRDSAQSPANSAAWNLSDEEWKSRLSAEEFQVLCGSATEPPFSGKYWNLKDDGTYSCAGCGLELFDSDTKYESGSGWPSFYAPVNNINILEVPDTSMGMQRTELICARCKGHLGHLFNDGPRPTGLRYCVNSAALDFEPAED